MAALDETRSLSKIPLSGTGNGSSRSSPEKVLLQKEAVRVMEIDWCCVYGYSRPSSVFSQRKPPQQSRKRKFIPPNYGFSSASSNSLMGATVKITEDCWINGIWDKCRFGIRGNPIRLWYFKSVLPLKLRWTSPATNEWLNIWPPNCTFFREIGTFDVLFSCQLRYFYENCVV